MAIHLSLCCALAPACASQQPSEASGAFSQAIESSDEELDDVPITGPDLDVAIDEVQADVDASLAAYEELVASLEACEEAADGDEPVVLCLTRAPVEGGSLIIEVSIGGDGGGGSLTFDEGTGGDGGSLTFDGSTGGSALTLDGSTGGGSLTIDGSTGGGSLTIDGSTGGGSLTIDGSTGGGEPVGGDQRAPVCAPDDPRQLERTQLETALKNIDGEITAAEARQKAAQTTLDAVTRAFNLGAAGADELDAATIAAAKANAALGRLKVQKDQLLPARLALNANPKDKDALRKQAQANVDIAKLNLAEAAALHKAAKGTRDRAALLVQNGVGTQAQLDQAEASYQAAKTAEETATTNLRTATEQLDALPKP